MKKWWLFFVAAAVASSGIALVLGRPAPEVTVDTVRLEPRAVEQKITCTGVVETAEKQSISLDVTCIIKEVLVEEGQTVEAGTPLVRVDKEASRLAGLTGQGGDALTLAAMAETITADKAGVVLAVNAKAGQPLEAGTPCVVVAPRSALQVRIAIKQKDLRTLEEGMPAQVSGDGFRRGSYEGALTEISATAHTAGSGETVVEGVVSLDEGQADDSLRLGLTAKAAVVVSANEAALVVPYDAVREDDQGKEFVYVLEDGFARRRELQVAEELSTGVLLADEALAGAEIITDPDAVTQDGMPVTVSGEMSR